MSQNESAIDAERLCKMTLDSSLLLSSADAEGVNLLYEEIDNLFAEVVEAGRADDVYGLLIKKNIPEVTLMIASNMLIYGYEDCEQEIKFLADNDPTMTGFNAIMFLREWKAGNIQKKRKK